MNKRIRRLRKIMDLTQDKFGMRIGVKGNTVAQWESGRNEPPDSAITFICKEFGVNEDWLRTGDGEIFKPNPTSELDALAAKFGLEHGAYVAIEKFLKLRPKVRSEIIAYFKEVSVAIGDVDPETPAYSDNVAAAEAAYEKSLGIVQNMGYTVSNTTEEKGTKNAEKKDSVG